MFNFKLEKDTWDLRAWEFSTPHGSFKTPIFMPVWTKATVKWIQNHELDEMWAEIILNNTYHLYLRPWDETIKKFWWVHKFQNYNKPILTDSWWFQVFSLWESTNRLKNNDTLVKITEEGVHFRSYIDGSKHFFTPEKVMNIQNNLWADIIMAFDECAPWNSTYEYARNAMNRTHNWAIRSIEQVQKNNLNRKSNWLYPQTLFPIVQWVIYDDLRIESAKFISNLDSDWVAIWWLSVWESKEDMYRILDLMNEHLPKNKPRYLMWVWTPEDLLEWISRWVDMFDCVNPTRIWRHWTAFSSNWKIKIKNSRYKLDDSKLDENCSCKVCTNYSKWYLKHLIWEKEMLWMQLLSYHNLHFLINLAKKSREEIINWKFDLFKKDFLNKYFS